MSGLNFWICPTCDSNNCTTGGYCPHCGDHRMKHFLYQLFDFPIPDRRVRVVQFPGNPTPAPTAANCETFPQDAA